MITDFISPPHRPTLTAVVLLTLMAGPASAATIVGGGCSLADAIISANLGHSTPECPNGGGNIIELSSDVTLTTVELVPLFWTGR